MYDFLGFRDFPLPPNIYTQYSTNNNIGSIPTGSGEVILFIKKYIYILSIYIDYELLPVYMASRGSVGI